VFGWFLIKVLEMFVQALARPTSTPTPLPHCLTHPTPHTPVRPEEGVTELMSGFADLTHTGESCLDLAVWLLGWLVGWGLGWGVDHAWGWDRLYCNLFRLGALDHPHWFASALTLEPQTAPTATHRQHGDVHPHAGAQPQLADQAGKLQVQLCGG